MCVLAVFDVVIIHERMMVRWMCGVSLKNSIASEELNRNRRLSVDGIAHVV
jgi:hypothetical protein